MLHQLQDHEADMFDSINQGWDVRILENQSPRTIFLGSIMASFLVGGEAVSIAYGIFEHRIPWPIVINLALFATLGFRYARIIYRRLGT